MLTKLITLPFRTIAKVAGVLLILAIIWLVFKPRSPQSFSIEEKYAVRELAKNMVISLTEKNNSGKVLMLPFLDDSGSLLRNSLAINLKNSGWGVSRKSLAGNFIDKVKSLITAKNWQEDILDLPKDLQVDYLITGKVNSVDRQLDCGYAEANLYVYSFSKKSWIIKDSFVGKWQPSFMEKLSRTIKSWSPFLRIVMWLAFTALLPWLTAFATRKVMLRQTNTASFIMLSSYLLLNAILTALLMAFDITGIIPIIAFLFAIFLAAVYNYWACETISDDIGR